ncbi:response regulator [Fischerella thermalis CCMEE 5201]|nr:response regulator [Fischerella thermalis CCMEE 5201]
MVDRRASQNSANKHILVCDDVEDNCYFLQIILELEGYTVDTVNSGEAVLAKLEVETFDLLLLDVMMPGMNGYEVAFRVQQNPDCQSLPIILITAHEQGLVEEECKVRVDGILRKPVDPETLLAQVQAILQHT